MHTTFAALEQETVSPVFLIRLGLTAVDLSGPGHVPAPILRAIASAASLDDAYPAAEILRHPVHTALSEPVVERLQDMVAAASLGRAPTQPFTDGLAGAARDGLAVVRASIPGPLEAAPNRGAQGDRR